MTAAEAADLGDAVIPTAALGWRHVGELRRTAAGVCGFLSEKGCGIYERRPQACRDFGKACRLLERAPQ